MGYAREEPALKQSSNQALVVAARLGDLEAFGELFMRFEPSVRGYLTGLCGDAELAADVAQETFLDLSRNVRQLRDDEAFAAWLYRSAHHRLRTETRRSWYRRAVSLDWLTSASWDHPSLTDRQEMGTEAQDRMDIQAVLNRLSPRLREALLLNRYAGLSCLEVARILQISPETAKKRITRACAEFRHYYQQERP